jgi:hypothetical protein
MGLSLSYFVYIFICENTLLIAPYIRYKKGKAIPLQGWTGPEGSWRLRLPYFKIIGTRIW